MYVGINVARVYAIDWRSYIASCGDFSWLFSIASITDSGRSIIIINNALSSWSIHTSITYSNWSRTIITINDNLFGSWVARVIAVAIGIARCNIASCYTFVTKTSITDSDWSVLYDFGMASGIACS